MQKSQVLHRSKTGREPRRPLMQNSDASPAGIQCRLSDGWVPKAACPLSTQAMTFAGRRADPKAAGLKAPRPGHSEPLCASLIADVQPSAHADTMNHASRLTLVAVTGVMLLSGCDLHRRPTLSKEEVNVCLGRGGRESRAPFGSPICQVPYGDAGKACSGKTDCLGQCLSNAPEHAGSISIGTSVAGKCEAESSTFGCYGRVEGGKLAEAYACVD